MAKPITEEQLETIRRMGRSGDSISDIIRATGLNRETIRKRLGNRPLDPEETPEEVEDLMRQVAVRESSRPHRAWERHGPTIPLVEPKGGTVEDKIATLLYGGHEPAAIATVLRRRFSEVMAVVKRLDAAEQLREREYGIQNEMSPVILMPEEIEANAAKERLESHSLVMSGGKRAYAPRVYTACVGEPVGDCRCGEFPSGIV